MEPQRSDLRGRANDGLHSMANTVSSQLHKINNSAVAARARGMASSLQSKIAAKIRSKAGNADDDRGIVLSAEDAARITELHRGIEEMAEGLKDGSAVVDESWLHKFTELHRCYMESCSCQGVNGDLTGTTDFLQFVLLHPIVQALLKKMDSTSHSESVERTLSNVKRLSRASAEAMAEIAGSQAIALNANFQDVGATDACPEAVGVEVAEAAGTEAASTKAATAEAEMAGALEANVSETVGPPMSSVEGAIAKPVSTETTETASTEVATPEVASANTSSAETADPEGISAKGASTEAASSEGASAEGAIAQPASAKAASLQAARAEAADAEVKSAGAPTAEGASAEAASAEAVHAEVNADAARAEAASAEAANAEAVSSEAATAQAETAEANRASSDVADSQASAEAELGNPADVEAIGVKAAVHCEVAGEAPSSASSPSEEPRRAPGLGGAKPKTGGYPDGEGDQELRAKLEAMRNRMAGGARADSPRSRRPAKGEGAVPDSVDGASRTMQEKLAARRARLESKQGDDEVF